MISDPKKHKLRTKARRQRAQQVIKTDDSKRACAHFFDVLNPSQDQIIAAYRPKGREFNPMPIMEQALQQGHQCALPVVEEGTRVLRFAPYTKDTKFKTGAYDIAEPESAESLLPDIIIVPLLAFDQRGYRLGQGGGYYDATLAYLSTQKKMTAVGIGYAEQLCDFPLPAEAHDHKMDIIITPDNVYTF